ncbi:hypothetical protein B0T10DRAFT_568294 [Thelonectria olida]|uniref:Transcription factor domain-containing protein n=1 Tax=Thelonectria olida TaxID=1576542 RepID=A0A9P9AIG1_9HYPO|nr:hypothetical protein B0T10DRAFT_568294 [Thelonectria olida]
MWLGLAVNHARHAGAHDALVPSTCFAEGDGHEFRMLKRLWWCCIIRDRSLSLLLHRDLVIRKSYPRLDASDLDDEISYLLIHDPAVQSLLVNRLVQPSCPVKVQGGTGTVVRCYQRQGSVPPTSEEMSNCSLVTFTNLIYTYSHASKLALHHQTMLFHMSRSELGGMGSMETSRMREEAQGAQDTAFKIASFLQELVHLRLAQYFPSTAVGFATLPLLLHALDVKLCSLENFPALAVKSRRLGDLLNTLGEYQHRYDGINAILTSGPRLGLGLIDFIAQRPECYLRLIWTVGMSMREVHIPDDSQFPPALQGLLNHGQSWELLACSLETPPEHDQGLSIPPATTEPFSAVWRPEDTGEFSSRFSSNASMTDVSFPSSELPFGLVLVPWVEEDKVRGSTP